MSYECGKHMPLPGNESLSPLAADRHGLEDFSIELMMRIAR